MFCITSRIKSKLYMILLLFKNYLLIQGIDILNRFKTMCKFCFSYNDSVIVICGILSSFV